MNERTTLEIIAPTVEEAIAQGLEQAENLFKNRNMFRRRSPNPKHWLNPLKNQNLPPKRIS
jgi:hypothetical protein